MLLLHLTAAFSILTASFTLAVPNTVLGNSLAVLYDRRTIPFQNTPFPATLSAAQTRGSIVHELDNDVGVFTSKLDSIPARMFYFENSEHVLLQESGPLGSVWHSSNEGKTWEKANGISAEVSGSSVLIQHMHAKETTAILLTRQKKHYITTDRGVSWRPFSTDLLNANNLANSLSFHATKPSYIMYRGRKCITEKGEVSCREDTYYTTDSFQTIKLLLPWTSDCVWAQNVNPKATELVNTVLCTEWPVNEQYGRVDVKNPTKLQLVKSDTFFADGTKSIVASNMPIVGISHEWLMAVSGSESNIDVHLSTSKDGSTFVKAIFPQTKFRAQVGYTILESSADSLFVDVLFSDPKTYLPLPFGTMYKSDSDGTYFIKSLDYTNRDLSRGQVDFERIKSPIFDGILMANIVSNWREIADRTASTKWLASVISFDNGARWQPLKPPSLDIDGKAWGCTPSTAAGSKCSLHLHSTTSYRNIGSVYSTQSAPGILIGVGSVGAILQDYALCDTFMSDDAGLTWKMVMRGPAKFEILDMGAVIVLVPDIPQSDKVLYTWNRGKTWVTLPLTINDKPWQPLVTLLDPSSTSQRMLLIANEFGGQYGSTTIFQLDFEHLQKRKCNMNPDSPEKSEDFELWTPRSSVDSKTAECLLGKTIGYYRVRADANCFIGDKFKNPISVTSICPCSDADYECDIEFEPSVSSTALVCSHTGPLRDQPLGCKEGEKYMGRSGYRKIPGDVCTNGDQSKTKPVERTCGKITRGGPGGPVVRPPSANRPVSHVSTISERIDQIAYLKETTIVFALTHTGQIWRSADDGVTWVLSYVHSALLQNKQVLRVAFHESNHKRTFIFTNDQIFVSDNALDDANHDIKLLAVPEPYNVFGIKIIDFHPDEPDWYVYVAGGQKCGLDPTTCHTTTYMTKDAGKTFTQIDTWSNKCLWARDFGFKDKSLAVDAIICSTFKYKDGRVSQDELRSNLSSRSNNPAHLVLLTNNGQSELVVVDADVFDFFVVDGIMLVDTIIDGSHASTGSLTSKLMVSTDAQQFIETKFPPGVSVSHSRFTILESTTGGVFLDAEMTAVDNGRSGVMFKSNENGEYFSKVLGKTHRSDRGRVDFEKINEIPGIIITNVVFGPLGQKEAIQTRMSFDDGSSWSSLVAPEVDSTGARIVCTSDPSAQKCNLHLHGITSMTSTFGLSISHSSKGAAGLLIGVGNAGDQLLAYNLGNVFISRDAGRSWIEVRKDAHKWAIADYGGLIVLVNDEKPVDTLFYSWDFGTTWAEHKFSDRSVRIEDVTTRQGAESRKVVITGHYISSQTDASSSSDELATALISVDFEKLFSRKCDLNADFEMWYPGSLPGSTDNKRCFFGEEAIYRRRKSDAVCYVGAGFEHVVADKKTCECADVDYECDFNFFRNDAGTCSLYSTNPDQPMNCPLGTTYKGSSGYRKISLSRCKGGKDLTGKIDRECSVPGSVTGQVSVTAHLLATEIDDFYYFNQTETIVAKDTQHVLYISRDQGKTWATDPFVTNAGQILAIMNDRFHPHRAFFMTVGENKLLYTNDNAKSFAQLSTPLATNWNFVSNFLTPHPTDESALLYIGVSDCAADPNACHAEAHVTFDFGKSWTLLTKYVHTCKWMSSTPSGFHSTFDRGVVCSTYVNPQGDQRNLIAMELVKFEDARKGGSDRQVLFRTSGFAIYDEYMVAAVPSAETREVSIQVSLDGAHWAEAYFPDKYLVRAGYTVLQSNTGSAFIHVIESAAPGREHGTLMKSNWNGTFYTELLVGVNQNRAGYVDFEKVEGIRGSIIVNQVSNIMEMNRGDPKKLQTKMSFDDGYTWNYLAAPKLDSNHNTYDCGSECYLHLHAYTERHDQRDLFSSSGSVGFMMGVGNVGSYLKDFTDGDTFITHDGGRTWTEIVKEAHMFEFGDHGGIIVLVNDEVYTDTIKYSVDGGLTIHQIRIGDIAGVGSGGKIRVSNILTDPSGTTSKMVVMGKLRDGANASVSFATLHLDFDTIWPRKCVINHDNPSKSDYEGWNPSLLQPGGGCLFGSNTTYYRRKLDRECMVGQAFQDLAADVQYCDCQMPDFECAAGYHSQNNQCVPDPQTVAAGETCSSAGILQGYRQKRISQCINADKVLPPTSHCVNVGYASSLWSWLWMILVALGIAGLCIWAVAYSRTHGGFAFLNRSSFRRSSYGPVQLPLDTDEAGHRSTSSMFSPANLGENIGTGIRTLGLIVIDSLVGSVVVAHKAYDWVRTRLTRAQGYTTVRTTVAGRFSFDDAQQNSGGYRDVNASNTPAHHVIDDDDALDLDWGDENDGSRHP
ncbi:vacuolar protein sorting/targeting protein PEP1 [Batrachochytrium dendrobatidis]|nr:vacuolar protein sorting/targeting protein PEP1 [Batrachochytrium dendrobatidis]